MANWPPEASPDRHAQTRAVAAAWLLCHLIAALALGWSGLHENTARPPSEPANHRLVAQLHGAPSHIDRSTLLEEADDCSDDDAEEPEMTSCGSAFNGHSAIEVRPLRQDAPGSAKDADSGR